MARKANAEIEITARNRAERALNGLGTDLDKVRSRARSLTGAVTVAAGAMAALAVRAIKTGDDIGKTADRLGLSTSALQELRFAAGQAGVSADTFDMAMQRLNRRIGEATKGQGEARDALRELGIELFDSAGNARTLEDVLPDIANSIASVEDQSRKLALTQKLVDSEGVALVNLFNQQADGMEGLRKQARDLGLVFDEAFVRQAERSNDELAIMQKQIDVNLSQAMSAIIPLTKNFSESVAQLAGAFKALQKFLGIDLSVPSTQLERFEKLASFTQARVDGLQNQIERFGGTSAPPKLQKQLEIQRAALANVKADIERLRAEADEPVTVEINTVFSGSSGADDPDFTRKLAGLRGFESVAAEKQAQRLDQELQAELQGRERIFRESLAQELGFGSVREQALVEQARAFNEERDQRRLEQEAVAFEQELSRLRGFENLKAELEFQKDEERFQARLVRRQLEFEQELAQALGFEDARAQAMAEQERRNREVLARERSRGNQIAQNAISQIREFEEAQGAQKVSVLLGQASDLASGLQSSSKKVFQIGKAAALAQAVIDGQSAIVGAYKHGASIGGPPLAALYATIAAAATATQIASIRSTTFSGGSGRGSFGGGGGGAPIPTESPLREIPVVTAEERNTREIVVRLEGGDDLTRAFVENVRTEIQEGDVILADRRSRQGLELRDDNRL